MIAKRRSTRLSLYLALTLIMVASSLVYTGLASNAIQTTTSIFEGLFGSYTNVTNRLVTLDRGFTLSTQTIPSSGTNQSAPILLSSTPAIASNGVLPGDWMITISVNTTSNTPTNRTFTVTLSFSEQGSTKLFKLYIATGPSLGTSQSLGVLCMFDIGPTLSSPYSFTLTVQ